MKKVLIALAALFVFALVLTPTYFSTINDLALERQSVEKSYGGIQIVLQRQAELLPNLAAAVRGYDAHEEKTIVGYAEGRSGASATSSAAAAIAALPASKLATDPEAQKQLAQVLASQSQALLQLRQTVESNPQLQSNDNYKNLMKQIEGSQNRIAIARKDNQDAVAKFNRKVVIYPAKLFASLGGYSELPFFKGDADAQHAPVLKF